MIPDSNGSEASTKKGQKMNSDKKWVTLNNGAKMPTIGMGTWHHGPREEIDAALRQDPLIHRLNLKIAEIVLKTCFLGTIYVSR